ncbi:MAG: DUF3244 domain-containing protein [Alistipes sp.]|nr:DUF3244 domain-containing protein [Alistipes sp.]
MKKITLLVLAIFCLAANVDSKDLTALEKKITNVILRDVTPKIQPRTGDLTPAVECYYYDGRINVNFYAPVDDVNLSVTNIYTGEQYDAYSSGSCQSIYVDVPTTSGYYYVEIEYESTILCGEYNL